MHRSSCFLNVARIAMAASCLMLASPSMASDCSARGDGCGCSGTGRCAHPGCACQAPAGNCGASSQHNEAWRPAQFLDLQSRILADRQPPQARAKMQRLGFTPCVGGMAGPFPCKDVNLLAYLPLDELGSDPAGDGANDIWGWTDPSSGKEYAIIGLQSSTAFVDISDPVAPIHLGNLPRHSPAACSIWRSIKVYSNPKTSTHHAFIASEAQNHGLQVFDLTKLRDPAPPGGFTETAWYGGTGSNPLRTVHTLAIDPASGFLYAAGTANASGCNGGLYMIDVRNALSPSFVGCFANDGYNHESQCVTYSGPDLAHQGREICFSSDVDTVTIVDVTNKSQPVQLSRTGYAGSRYTHQTWLTEDQRHLLLDDELDETNFGHNSRTYIWNVSDLDAPVVIGHYTGTSAAIDHNQYIRGDLVYQSNYRSGLRILHTGSIADGILSEMGFLDVYPADDDPEFNGTWTNYPFFASGVVVASGIEQGLFVLQPALGSTPTALPTRTPTRTRTATRTATPTRSLTPTHTWTQTSSPSATAVSSAMPEATSTPTQELPTSTPIESATPTPEVLAATPSATSTNTAEATATSSATATASATAAPVQMRTSGPGGLALVAVLLLAAGSLLSLRRGRPGAGG